MKLTKKERERRTATFLMSWYQNKREFDHLHGVLCLSHGWTASESVELGKIIDFGMIAARLDEINKGR